MAFKNKNKTNKKRHCKNQVNKHIRQNPLHSLSLLATDNVGTFSRLRLLSLSCIYIFAQRQKLQFLLGCFLSSSCFLACFFYSVIYGYYLTETKNKVDLSPSPKSALEKQMSAKALAKVVSNKQLV